ncbi:hypothetical protein ACEWY4_009101 [Coilia grayii]|uniref:Ig-like domain-containing protein n=1 Tax=Coilia grayii TaxID=363190 RepID=A0ABD1K5I8_9TELE
MVLTQRLKMLSIFIIFFRPGVSSTAVVTITARQGENTSLPCVVKPSQGSVTQMQWQRQGKDYQEEIIVVYNPIYGEHKQSHHKGRVRIIKNPSNNKAEEFHLDLEDVELNDTGLYICDIHTFPKGAVQQHVKLDVEGKEGINMPVLPPTTEMPVSVSSRLYQRTTLHPTTSSHQSNAQEADRHYDPSASPFSSGKTHLSGPTTEAEVDEAPGTSPPVNSEYLPVIIGRYTLAVLLFIGLLSCVCLVHKRMDLSPPDQPLTPPLVKHTSVMGGPAGTEALAPPAETEDHTDQTTAV